MTLLCDTRITSSIPNTRLTIPIASYMRDLRQYASYLGSEGIDVLDADQTVVSSYMGSMKACGKSAATISRALASIKSLYIFAIQNHEIEENPIQNIKIDKAEKKLPQILTGKEVELLLQQPKVSEMKGCRDKAMLEVLVCDWYPGQRTDWAEHRRRQPSRKLHSLRKRGKDAHHPDLSGSASGAA